MNKVDRANHAACDELQALASRLVLSGFQFEQVNVILQAVLPLANANARLRHRLEVLERRERTQAQVMEDKADG